ncbi:ArsR/SmtB family transcription factor [Streptomyces albipurpureus]|uniref:Helix-turn-helix domain-containing protein n=1 Tax=Streptomyces albipurpureus TaxID=2897419 RepID=A0ABT0UY73_9ACTN|nr:winged helix-turn-helix domain-containing protein [Streptomyces sp. CWNU-1]MCM2392258.1 helix-turn-helix domain-containing protein [Streptomyces sp. CWNU-1]
MSEPSPEPRYRPLDPRSLRGIAHPLRMRLLTVLRHDGPATASQLAERLGESSGATSYHLRQLAAHGFVQDDPGRGTGRERWWKASTEGTSIDHSLLNSPDVAVRGAASLFIQEVAAQHAEEVSTWLSTEHQWPTRWRQSSDLSDFTLRLTPARAQELNREVHALIESYREREPGQPAITPEAVAPSSDAVSTDAVSAVESPDAEAAAQVRIHLHFLPRSTHSPSPAE